MTGIANCAGVLSTGPNGEANCVYFNGTPYPWAKLEDSTLDAYIDGRVSAYIAANPNTGGGGTVTPTVPLITAEDYGVLSGFTILMLITAFGVRYVRRIFDDPVR